MNPTKTLGNMNSYDLKLVLVLWIVVLSWCCFTNDGNYFCSVLLGLVIAAYRHFHQCFRYIVTTNVRGCRGRHHIVVGFITTYALSTYHY